MDVLTQILDRIRQILSISIYTPAGGTPVTMATILTALAVFVLLLVFTGVVKRGFLGPVLRRTPLSHGLQSATTKIAGYLMVFIGTLIIVQSAGVDLTTLNVVAGAIGIGVGFGLQNIASNFISGLIILFERPIKVGDRVEVGDVLGDVTSINARATTILTNDNISIIVPNEVFISQNVTNWSYNDQKVRFKICVGVAYGSDTRLVEKLLLQVARENKSVLDEPAAVVRFMEFGDSALNFELRVFSQDLLHREGRLRSELNFAIDDLFRANKIAIPYPQRDLHIKSAPKDFVTEH